MNKITWSFFYNNCKEKANESIRLAKTRKAADSFYKGIYFFGASIWGYYILRNEKYLPKELLGRGDASYFYADFPTHSWPENL